VRFIVLHNSIENADDFAQWLLETYDLNGETVMVAPAAGFTLLLDGFESGSNCLRAKKRRFNSCSTNYKKQRYQSITQGKVMKKG
jgi:hypothetical protein